MVLRHGGIRHLMSLVHLPWRDAAAFLVLLIGLTGQNELPPVLRRPDYLVPAVVACFRLR